MKKFFLIAIAFGTFASSGLFAHLYNRTDDLSLRYMLWKKGLHPLPSDVFLGAVLADPNGKELFRGKTKEQLEDWFPDLHKESVNDYQRMYDKELSGQDYLWIGKTEIIVVFKDGKAESLKIMKG